MFSELPKSLRVVYWLLFFSYLIGSPAMMVVEFRGQLLSERFGYVPEIIYIVGIVQVLSVLLLRVRPAALWSLVVLTVLSLGAVWSHLKIGSPLTSVPALVYTALQIWLGVYVYRKAHSFQL